jgi:hypothetical protein
MRRIHIIIILLLIVSSCDWLQIDPEESFQQIVIQNRTSDTLRIYFSDSIGVIDEIFVPQSISFSESRCTIYSRRSGYPPVILTQNDLDSVFANIDSILIFYRHNDLWHEADIPQIYNFENWILFSKTDDYYEEYYSFYITDSLLNL